MRSDYYLKNMEILITPPKYIRIGGIRINKRYLGVGIALILLTSIAYAVIVIVYAISTIKYDEIKFLDSSIITIVIAIIGLILDYFALIKKPQPIIQMPGSQIRSGGFQSPTFMIDKLLGDVHEHYHYYPKNYKGDEGHVKD